MKKKRTFTVHRVLEVLKYIPLVIWVVFFVFAFGWILLASFSTTREIFSGTLLDSGVHLENYTNVWKDNNVGRYFINSIPAALSCALASLYQNRRLISFQKSIYRQTTFVFLW
ncbi:MAG: hypothetical protein ACLVLH_01660 [Eisenbergiella massiliensis]